MMFTRALLAGVLHLLILTISICAIVTPCQVVFSIFVRLTIVHAIPDDPAILYTLMGIAFIFPLYVAVTLVVLPGRLGLQRPIDPESGLGRVVTDAQELVGLRVPLTAEVEPGCHFRVRETGFHVRRRRIRLRIGVCALAMLSVDDCRALIVHELAHVIKGHTVVHLFRRVLDETLDVIVLALERAEEIMPWLFRPGFGWIARIGMVMAFPAYLAGHIARWITRHRSASSRRLMETEADQLARQLVGSTTYNRAQYKLRQLSRMYCAESVDREASVATSILLSTPLEQWTNLTSNQDQHCTGAHAIYPPLQPYFEHEPDHSSPGRMLLQGACADSQLPFGEGLLIPHSDSPGPLSIQVGTIPQLREYPTFITVMLLGGLIVYWQFSNNPLEQVEAKPLGSIFSFKDCELTLTLSATMIALRPLAAILLVRRPVCILRLGADWELVKPRWRDRFPFQPTNKHRTEPVSNSPRSFVHRDASGPVFYRDRRFSRYDARLLRRIILSKQKVGLGDTKVSR